MKILFNHLNHPAQFRRIAPYLASKGHDVVFLCQNNEWHAPKDLQYHVCKFTAHREGGGAFIHPYLRRLEKAIILGQAVFNSSKSLKDSGWIPDFIVNHVGFGNGLYLSDVFPTAKRIGFFEWYYNSTNSDVDFMHKGEINSDRKMCIRGWNSQILLELADVDFAIVPTQWQLEQFPKWIRPKLQVIHEGIDVGKLSNLSKISPANSRFNLPKDPNIKVVTYVSRGFEEYRGFPQAMKAFSLLQKMRPDVHILLAGADVVAYGSPRKDSRTWRQWALDEVPLDPKRTHWLGMLQEDAYHDLLCISHAQLYLTVPFVLSWSLLEAMAVGCSIVASSTAPVKEVLSHNQNALLVDFWDPHSQAEALNQILTDQKLSGFLSNNAKKAAKSYDSKLGLAAWEKLFC